MPIMRRKMLEWTRRYLPAELLGTATALLGGVSTHYATGEVAAAAAAGAVAENVGYYGWFAVQETRRHLAVLHRAPARRRRAAGRAGRDLVIEFGPAEALDSLLVRPVLMYAGVYLVGPVAGGLLAGKLAADLVFYGCAILGYELRRRHIDADSPPAPPERTTCTPHS